MRNARFEDAIQWVINGGVARRAAWAKVPQYTHTTPPLNYDKTWRIWLSSSSGQIVQGWGGQIGMEIAMDDPVRDGTTYQASNEDRIASDWELMERRDGNSDIVRLNPV